jgi:hypothetical protein
MRHLRLAALFVIFMATMSMAQSNPQPLIYPSLVPVSTAPGGPGFSLTVGGYGFAAGAVVQWNGSPRTTTFISSSSLQAAITAADVAKAGTALITVLNPAPGGGTSNTVYFQVTNPEATVSVALDSTLTTPATIVCFTVADFNGDGILDLVAGVVTPNGFGIEFYQGNGDGTFKPPVLSRSSSFSTLDPTIVLGDFNGDGRPDLIVSGYLGFSESSVVFLNNGDGTFSQQKTFAEGDYGGPAAVGDFDGDGNLDLLQLGCTQGYCNLFFLKGNGKGSFGNSHIIDGIQNIYGNVAVGDFNGDGKLDFVVTGNPVFLFLGNGDGTFRNPSILSTTTGGAIAAADLNGDGNLDLLMTSGADGLCVLLGNGDGTFNSNCFGADQYGGTINLGDFTGDGKLDVAVNEGAEYPSIGQIAVLPGNGDGTFQSPIVAGASTYVTLIGDFNSDGRLDFASTSNIGVSLDLQTSAALAPLSLTYATQEVGTTSAPQIVTVTNSGSSPLQIASVTMGGINPADFGAISHCGSSVAAGGSCTISVVFKPTTYAGRFAALTVTYAGGVKTSQIMELSGTGSTTNASFSPTSLAFGFQIVGTTSAAMMTTLTNSGPGILTISGFSINGPFNFTNNCGSTLAVNASCQVFVTFTPTAVFGASGALTASTDAQNGPIAVGLSGTGTYLLVSPTSINFGNQAVGTSSAPAVVTLTNEGHSQVVHLSPISLSGTDRKDFTETTTCGTTLSPGASCTVTVTFTPTAKGARSASVQIDGGYGLQAVALSGTGT